jgi:hypothetical protein
MAGRYSHDTTGNVVMTKEKKRNPAYLKASLLAAIMLLVGGKWYLYVAHADSPFDDVGASINSFMPAPINRIGCDMLKQRFGNIPIPPKGCSIDGRWA